MRVRPAVGAQRRRGGAAVPPAPSSHPLVGALSGVGTVSANLVVPSGMTILADLDWTTGTGTSLAVLQDDDNPNNGNAYAQGSGGPVAAGEAAGWGTGPSGPTYSVVAGSSVGLPSGFGNALSFEMFAGASHVQFPHIFPLPQDGQDQYWAVRAYYRNDTGQTDTEQHPHCLWPVGVIESIPCSIVAQSGGNGIWHPGARFTNDAVFPFGVYPFNGSSRIWLQPDTWYRYEFIMHWRNATQYRPYLRLYDSDDVTLLADNTNFAHTDIPSLSYAAWYAASEDNWFVRTSNSPNPNNMRTFSFGNGQAKTNGSFYRVAKATIALVTSPSDFIGAP
jgi:hypothetical protein